MQSQGWLPWLISTPPVLTTWPASEMMRSRSTKRCWPVRTSTTHTMKQRKDCARLTKASSQRNPMLSRDRANMQGNGPGKTRPRRLLLGLDGVPHALINEARSRGLFDSFASPARLLSPFPTMTNVALSAMFGASPPAGYESLYFDRTAHEQRGGIKKYIGRRTPDKIVSSYMDELDYQEPLAFEF